MLKQIAKNIVFIGLLCLASGAGASLINATAELNYEQEVNPNNSTPSQAFGIASLVFDTNALTVDIMAEITGINLQDITFPAGVGLAFGAAGPFHIHQGIFGANGGIQVAFNMATSYTETATGLLVSAAGVAFNADILDDLRSGGLYLNMHTLDYSSGEIRGQIAVVSAPNMLALLMVLAGGIAIRGAYKLKQS